MDDADRQLIEETLRTWGMKVQVWDESDGRPRANLGQAVMTEDGDPEMGPFEDEEGALSATIVGAQEYGNRRVEFIFKAEDQEGLPVDPGLVELV